MADAVIEAQMTLILSCHRGHMHYTPYLTLAVVRPHQHTQQLAYVSPIALGPTLSPIDLDR